MYDKYKIESGDNLNSIAKKFNTDVEFLKTINNLYYVDNLREGMEIIVPEQTEDYFDTYVIESGDTLYAIGQKYNINPELLASLNGLEIEDYIYPDQQIMIPKAGYSYYITKDGDTLLETGRLFKTSLERLLKQNPTLYLMPGQIIVSKKIKA